VLFVQKWNNDPTKGPLCPHVDDYNIFFATQRVQSKDSSGEKIYRRQKTVRYFVGEVGSTELIDYDEEDFFKEYGSIKNATLYRVFFRNGKQTEMNLSEIEAQFGSLENLELLHCERIINLRKPIPGIRLLRDTNGHLIVQHDLFNHEGLTQDGIAEAFAEFAKKERLSFF
jgi:type I restriction enzyme M protein